MKDRQQILKEFKEPLKSMDYFGLLCAEKALNSIYNDLITGGHLSPNAETIIRSKRDLITDKIKNFK